MTWTGNIFKIQRYSIHDGPGIRTTLFFQGCPLSCIWCHNPESQKMPDNKDESDMEDKICAMMKEIEKDRMFYEESGGGVTFSGGEPLSQPDLLLRLLDQCSEKDIHTCLDTSGYAGPEIFLTAARKADLIFYDLKLMDESAHRAFTGKNNRPVLQNLKLLSDLTTDVHIRFPFIPTLTDTKENISQLISFLLTETPYRDIHILPFHKTGEGKYEALNMINHMKKISPPTEKKLARAAEQFKSQGFRVTLGG